MNLLAMAESDVHNQGVLSPKEPAVVPSQENSLETPSKIMSFINEHPVLKSFLTGAFSGTCSTLMFQPLDLVKTRLQNPNGLSLGMMSLAIEVVRKENVLALWKGTVPSVARCVPGVGMYFCSLHWLQVSFGVEDPGPMEAICLGVFARSLAGASLLPFTVIKTRFESGIYDYKSLRGALTQLYKTEGTRGLFRGLIPTLFRDAPFSGLYLLFYTQTKRLLPIDNSRQNRSSPYLNFMIGLFSGACASALTQPADVLKTRMQLYPQKYRGSIATVRCIYREEGAKAFFSGLLPRLVRRTLMAAMAWTIYEQAMRGVGFR